MKRGKVLQDKVFATQLEFPHVLLGKDRSNGMNSGPVLVHFLVDGIYTMCHPFFPS